jgi:hypothetical protein
MSNKSKRKYGGSLRRSTRTKKPTVVETPVQLTRDELSGKIQWLIDFAGTDNVMEAVIEYFVKSGCKNVKRETVNGELKANYQNKIILNTRTGDVGHWIYFSKTGQEFNSYKLGHQKPATNQFCQSFATLYLLKNCGIASVPDFYGRLQSVDSNTRLTDRHVKWGHNVEVIIDMWKWIFGQWSSINAWLIGELKKINDDYKAINAKTRVHNKKMTLIDDDSNNITMALVTSKLNDIVAHKVLIAEKT